MHSKTYGRVNACVHEKVLVLFQKSFNATTIFLQLRYFLWDISQEVRVGPIKSNFPIWLQHVAVIFYHTNSSATQNHVVFQPTSEQAKYGVSGKSKKSKASAVFL